MCLHSTTWSETAQAASLQCWSNSGRLCFRTFFCRSRLPAQIEGTVNQADVAIGLREIPQHAAAERINFFREQAHVIAARKQAIENHPSVRVTPLQDVVVYQPGTARQKSSFARRQAIAGIFRFVS